MYIVNCSILRSIHLTHNNFDGPVKLKGRAEMFIWTRCQIQRQCLSPSLLQFLILQTVISLSQIYQDDMTIKYLHVYIYNLSENRILACLYVRYNVQHIYNSFSVIIILFVTVGAIRCMLMRSRAKYLINNELKTIYNYNVFFQYVSSDFPLV